MLRVSLCSVNSVYSVVKALKAEPQNTRNARSERSHRFCVLSLFVCFGVGSWFQVLGASELEPLTHTRSHEQKRRTASNIQTHETRNKNSPASKRELGAPRTEK